MKVLKTKEEIINTIINEEDILIVQDLDGVCIPLVQDPLKRELNKGYVEDVSKLKEYATGKKPTLKEFVQSKKKKRQS